MGMVFIFEYKPESLRFSIMGDEGDPPHQSKNVQISQSKEKEGWKEGRGRKEGEGGKNLGLLVFTGYV